MLKEKKIMCENLVLFAFLAFIIGSIKAAFIEAENPSIDAKTFSNCWREFDLIR